MTPDMNIRDIIENNDININCSKKNFNNKSKNINSKLVIFLEHMYFIFSNLDKCKIKDFEYETLLKFLRTDVDKHILKEDFISLLECFKNFKFHEFINTLEADVENNVFKQTYKTCIFYDMNKKIINDIDSKMFSKIYNPYDETLYYDWDGVMECSKTPRKNYYTSRLNKVLMKKIITNRCSNDDSESSWVCHDINRIIYIVYFTRPMVTLFLLLVFSIDWNKVKEFNEFRKNIKTIKNV